MNVQAIVAIMMLTTVTRESPLVDGNGNKQAVKCIGWSEKAIDPTPWQKDALKGGKSFAIHCSKCITWSKDHEEVEIEPLVCEMVRVLLKDRKLCDDLVEASKALEEEVKQHPKPGNSFKLPPSKCPEGENCR